MSMAAAPAVESRDPDARETPAASSSSWCSWMPSSCSELMERLSARQTIQVFAATAAYCALNMGLNDYTAYIFGSHEHQLMLNVPTTFSLFNHALGFIVWSSLLCTMPRTLGFPSWTLFTDMWGLLTLYAFIDVTNIAAQNASLARIELTLNQMIKSLTIIPTLALARCIEGRTVSVPAGVALLVQASGAFLAARVEEEHREHEEIKLQMSAERRASIDSHPSWVAWLQVAYTVFASSIRPVILGYMLTRRRAADQAGPRLTPIVLSWYNSVISSLIMLPVALLLERDAMRDAMDSEHASSLWTFLFLGSMMAALYNLTIILLVREISSIGYQALAQFNTVVVIGGAAAFIDHISAWEVWAGILICLIASTVYVIIRRREVELATPADPSSTSKSLDGAPADAPSAGAPTESTPLNYRTKSYATSVGGALYTVAGADQEDESEASKDANNAV